MIKRTLNQIILETMLNIYDNEGSVAKVTASEIYAEITREFPDLEKTTGLDNITVGKIEMTLRKLSDDRVTDAGLIKIYRGNAAYTGDRYAAKSDTYEKWVNEGGKTENMIKSRQKWDILKVENNTEISQQLNTLAEQLNKDNIYMAKHKIEADYTICTIQNTADLLDKNDGEVIQEMLDYALQLLNRILLIFNTATAIGKMVAKLIQLFRNMIG